MIRLDRIYTKSGDSGSTGLGDGSRVPKNDPRVEAYGTVDEANAVLGLAVLACAAGERAHEPRAATPDAGADPTVRTAVRSLLESIQHDLFDVGADLCCPITQEETTKVNAGGTGRLRVTAAQTQRLERAIDLHNAHLAPLTSFVLPGGSPQAAAMHQARTVVRRAERLAAHVLAAYPHQTNPETLRYLNRLSDLLFVLARLLNTPAAGGTGDVLWRPGANRSP